jgi:sulfur carrier protein ThiS
MIKVNFNNQSVEIPIGTKVIDLLNESEKTNYVVCQIGSLIKELNFELTEKNN